MSEWWEGYFVPCEIVPGCWMPRTKHNTEMHNGDIAVTVVPKYIDRTEAECRARCDRLGRVVGGAAAKSGIVFGPGSV